jgi:hypothetical protein
MCDRPELPQSNLKRLTSRGRGRWDHAMRDGRFGHCDRDAIVEGMSELSERGVLLIWADLIVDLATPLGEGRPIPFHVGRPRMK